MNIQEEKRVCFDVDQNKQKRVCFDVDQNKQKINYLLKKNKENETQQTELNQKLATAQSDINSLSSAVETLQNANTGEEKIELLSYDIYRNRDIMYRNNHWKPTTIVFLCDPGAKFKLHIWFTVKGDYPTSMPGTATTTINVDGEEVLSKSQDFEGSFAQDIEYTGFFSSKQKVHKLVINTTNTRPTVGTDFSTRSDMINVELWGTNVIFLTRKNDFHVFPGDTQVAMATSCIDEKTRFCIQNADQDLSFDKSNFRTMVSSRVDLFTNQTRPFITYYMGENGNPVYDTKASLIVKHFPAVVDEIRCGIYCDITTSQTNLQSPLLDVGQCIILCPMLTNSTLTTNKAFKFMAVRDNIPIYISDWTRLYTQFSYADEKEIIDINGAVRFENNSTTAPIVCIVTLEDGNNYLFEAVDASFQDPSKYDIGFGTNVNAYATTEGIKIFMRVGKDVKMLLVNKNQSTGNFEITKKEIIKDIQEYWLAPNGTHFERVGDKIYYFLQGSATPQATFTLDI